MKPHSKVISQGKEYILGSDKIGEGSFGQVWTAWDGEKETIAVKFFAPKEGLSFKKYEPRFVEEAKRMEGFSHPNIIPVYDFQPDGHGEIENPYYTMEQMSQSLETLLLNEKEIPLEQGAAIIIRLCEALQYAYRKGIKAHNDIHPGNILLAERLQPKLGDFGMMLLEGTDIQEIKDTAITAHETIGGMTNRQSKYTAPEVRDEGREYATEFSDMYSLGAILDQLVEPHFGDERRGKLIQIADDALRLRPELRKKNYQDLPEFAEAIRKSIRKAEPKPKKVFQTTPSFQSNSAPKTTSQSHEETGYVNGVLMNPQATQTTTKPAKPKKSKTNWILPFALAVPLAIGAIVGYAYINNPEKTNISNEQPSATIQKQETDTPKTTVQTIEELCTNVHPDKKYGLPVKGRTLQQIIRQSKRLDRKGYENGEFTILPKENDDAKYEILAANDGIIKDFGIEDGDEYIIIDHCNGMETIYHSEEINIKIGDIEKGQEVKKGDVIGIVGFNTDGSPLTFKFRVEDEKTILDIRDVYETNKTGTQKDTRRRQRYEGPAEIHSRENKDDRPIVRPPISPPEPAIIPPPKPYDPKDHQHYSTAPQPDHQHTPAKSDIPERKKVPGMMLVGNQGRVVKDDHQHYSTAPSPDHEHTPAPPDEFVSIPTSTNE